jgi:flavin reductase (DIM6/NTAB) family NADH-FMN oxidoreductase RutF
MLVDPQKTTVQEFHKLLLSAVAPRPIAFASTVDSTGNVNLSPFSFFNAFSANPPVLIFSPARRIRDNTIKHTLENVQEVKEVVINVVNYDLVEQASLASTEYDKGVNEFTKAGMTALPSLKVRPPRVAESPVAFECEVKQIIALGSGNGAGNLIVCEVLLAHCKEDIFDNNGKINPHKIDLVARMGEDYYCRASGNAVFEVTKPLQRKGIGIDAIPFGIRNSNILTGNHLGRLGNTEKLPERMAIQAIKRLPEILEIYSTYPLAERIDALHHLASVWLEKGRVEDAWKVLLLEID